MHRLVEMFARPCRAKQFRVLQKGGHRRIDARMSAGAGWAACCTVIARCGSQDHNQSVIRSAQECIPVILTQLLLQRQRAMQLSLLLMYRRC